VANLPIFPPLVYNPVDVNFLSYNMVSVPEVQGYIQFTVVLYPGTPSVSPLANPTSVTGQTVTTCPPYATSPVDVYGITADSDFSIPADGVPELVTPSQVNRKVTGAGGPYNSFIFKSVGEDWDGDTISDHYDHCDWDPNSGAAAGDLDGDGLTGLCETTGAGNGESNNPGPYGTAANAWSTGQDVDGDTFINTADTCSIVADVAPNFQLDTDTDGVGDVCETSPLLGLPAGAELVAGDGSGYPGKLIANIVVPGTVVEPQVASASPGKFVDRDNVCADPFTIGAAEPTLDDGRLCLGVDAVGRPFNVPSGISALARVIVDSNDDADPDLLDWPATAPVAGEWLGIEWMDTNSDSDSDGDTDACEAFVGTDPLDASSSPASPAGDCDSGGGTDAAEEAAGTSPFSGLNPDADGDGCTRTQESPAVAGVTPGQTAAGGVSYQDSAWYDFYDVPSPTNNDPVPNGTRNKAVNVADVVGVLKYVGSFENGASNGKVDYDSDKDGNGIKDGIDYDRSPSLAPNPPKDAGAPNGAVNVQDVVAVLGQTGRSCL
jgi:hypothetical protein